MKRTICLVLVIILTFLLQTTVFQNFALADTVPNLLVIVIVSIGYMRGKYEAMFLGLFTGLLVDATYCDIIGVYAFLFTVIGYLTGCCNKICYRDNYGIPILLVGISDLFLNFCYFVLTFLLRNRTNIGFYFQRIMLPEVIYTVVVSIIIYRFMHYLIRLLERSKSKEA